MHAAEKFIYDILSNSSDVTNIVGSNIFPVANLKQTTAPPYITYQRISTSPNNTTDASSSMDWVRIQINCVSDNYSSSTGVCALTDAVRLQLDYVFGAIDNYTIQNCSFVDEGDLPFINDAQLDGIYGKHMDFLISLNLV